MACKFSKFNIWTFTVQSSLNWECQNIHITERERFPVQLTNKVTSEKFYTCMHTYRSVITQQNSHPPKQGFHVQKPIQCCIRTL